MVSTCHMTYGIYLVYNYLELSTSFWYWSRIGSAMVYTKHKLRHLSPGICHIPGIYLSYDKLWQVYTRYIPGIYCMLSYVGYIPGIYHYYKLSTVSKCMRVHSLKRNPCNLAQIPMCPCFSKFSSRFGAGAHLRSQNNTLKHLNQTWSVWGFCFEMRFIWS
jgi:hypothetical protein